MTRLSWDNSGTRLYQTGVDRGVLYPSNGSGVAWNGLISVNETPSGDGVVTQYYDGKQYQSKIARGDFAASISAFTYPDNFEETTPFGFSYRTLVGNDLLGTDYGYRVHLVYNAVASPVQAAFSSNGGDSTNATPFNWNVSTTPLSVSENLVAAHMIVDATQAHPWTLQAFESLIYGDEENSPRLPTPQELLALFDENSILKITVNEDGTWTAEGPDDVVSMLDATTFQINWPSVVYVDSDNYTVSSL